MGGSGSTVQTLAKNSAEGDDRRAKSFDRLMALSDGIFAFAITLLALDLVTPVIVGHPSDATLFVALTKEGRSFLGFFVSFWIISTLWQWHQRIFSYIKWSDLGLIRLNLVLLFFVVLIPFATRVLNYGFLRLALDVFAMVFIGASLMTSIIWKYASSQSHHLLCEGVSQKTNEWLSNRGFISAAIFVLSIFLAFVNPYLTIACWLSVLPIAFVLDRRYSKTS